MKIECNNNCDWKGAEADLEDDENGGDPHCPKCGSNSFILDVIPAVSTPVESVVLLDGDGFQAGHNIRRLCAAEKLSTAEDVVLCSRCSGTGIDDWEGQDCEFCGGTGELEV